jgi:hypothetical protein
VYAAGYEIRTFELTLPVAEEARTIVEAHLNQPLDTLLPALDQMPDGLLQLLATVSPRSNWDGTDLIGLPGVNTYVRRDPIPITDGGLLSSVTEIPFEYLELRSDGRYDRKIGFVQKGRKLTLRREIQGQTQVRVTLTHPGPRKPIDGVSLDVGLPIQQDEVTNFIMHTPRGQWTVALLAMKYDEESPPELLLVFLRDMGGSLESEGKVPTAPIQFSVEAKFLRLPYEPIVESMLIHKSGERITTRDSMLIRDSDAVPIAGNGQRITAIKLPDSDQPIPVSDFDWERLQTAFPDEKPELLSAPRVTTMAGLTDRKNPSNTLFKIVLPNGPTNPLGRIFDKDRFGGSDPGGGGFGGGGFGGGGFGGGGQKSAEPIRDIVTLFDDLSPLVGDVVRSEGPGKPAVIADVMTHKIKLADEAGIPIDSDEVYTGISVALKITCNSVGEDIVLDVALVEIYLDWPPAIKVTRKGSPARPTPIEYSVPDETTLPRRIERSCRFRQPVENGETLAYLLRDDVRDDLTLVFVTIERVEGGAAFFEIR